MTIGIDAFRDPAELRLDRMLAQPFRKDSGVLPLVFELQRVFLGPALICAVGGPVSIAIVITAAKRYLMVAA